MELVTDLGMYLQLVLALALGAILGLERLLAGKEAGMRTFGLVSVGACLFVIIGELMAEAYAGTVNVDPTRMASSIVTGIGFIGAGLIIFQHELKGLTTAAALWVASAIGTAVGFGLYNIAIFTTFLTLFVTVGLWFFEHYLQRTIVVPPRE
jgi:putative Mg2+ transporter-C (MgtC) family protein